MVSFIFDHSTRFTLMVRFYAFQNTLMLTRTLMMEKIRRKPLYRLIDVIGDVKDDYGLDIEYHHTWLGVEKSRRGIYNDEANSFQQLIL